MAPRGLTNPAPKTESARSALSSFTCTLCNKSYSRHPEYEAHIGSYDHQHRKRLQDLKQLSRDPLAAEKARRAEKKADAEAGLRVIGSTTGTGAGGAVGSSSSGGGGGGFKKGGFKSSFTTVEAPVAASVSTKNVLGDDDEDEDETPATRERSERGQSKPTNDPSAQHEFAESDTDEEYARDRTGGGYYDPRKPTDCFAQCAGAQKRTVARV